MRVLLVSKFLRSVGGVETYIRWQLSALLAAGHEVALVGMDAPRTGESLWVEGVPLYFTPTRDFHGPVVQRARSAAASVYSRAVKLDLEDAISEFRPQVVHFHGTCYQLTPSVFRGVEGLGVPGMVTAHEYKLVCANQRLWDDRKQEECYACVGLPVAAKAKRILERCCVKGSRGASTLASVEQVVSERILRSSSFLIHAPSRYMMRTLQEDGYEEHRLQYMDLPWETTAVTPAVSGRSVIVFIGRLSREKGVDRLLAAWRLVEERTDGLSLRIAGDGDARGESESLATALGLQSVSFTGRYSPDSLDELLGDAVATIHPSVWAENSPFTVRESLSRGVPALVSNRGGLPEMIEPATGSSFDPLSPEEIAEAIVNEARSPRAATEELVNAVARRRVSATDHLDWLVQTYESLR